VALLIAFEDVEVHFPDLSEDVVTSLSHLSPYLIEHVLLCQSAVVLCPCSIPHCIKNAALKPVD